LYYVLDSDATYCVCVVDADRHLIVTAYALFFFVISSYSIFPPKFAIMETNAIDLTL